MGTVMALTRTTGLFPPLAWKPHRLLGCPRMVAGGPVALLDWASGPRLDLRP